MKHRKQGLKILPHSSLLGGSIAAKKGLKDLAEALTNYEIVK